jgi:hypothetical protein
MKIKYQIIKNQILNKSKVFTKKTYNFVFFVKKLIIFLKLRTRDMPN